MTFIIRRIGQKFILNLSKSEDILYMSCNLIFGTLEGVQALIRKDYFRRQT